MTTNKDMTLWAHEPENIHPSPRNITLIFASQGKSDGIAAFGDNWTGTTFLCSAAQPQSKMNFEKLHLTILSSWGQPRSTNDNKVKVNSNDPVY